jgi:hypothetical protein
MLCLKIQNCNKIGPQGIDVMMFSDLDFTQLISHAVNRRRCIFLLFLIVKPVQSSPAFRTHTERELHMYTPQHSAESRPRITRGYHIRDRDLQSFSVQSSGR